MKIAIIGNGFSGATLPLAQHLCINSIDVDCYYIVKVGSKCIESLDFDTNITLSWYPQIIDKKNRIYKYLNRDVNIYVLPIIKRRTRLEKMIVGKLLLYFDYLLINKFANYIIKKNYDVVNLIVHSPFEVILAKKLNEAGVKLVISYHEVLKGHTSIPELKKEVLDTLNLNLPIIIHSEKTKNDLLNLSRIQLKTKVIRFGAFESYLSYGKGQALGLEKGFILYLGNIFPYKGLKYLYEAVEKFDLQIGKKIVVAGNGHDEILKKMEQDERFIVINRFIDNAELVWLMINCSFIVCPYISGSQSGLVQTAMVFQKPVLATQVGAFSEILKDGGNGKLINPCDSKQLAYALKEELHYNKRKAEYPQLDWNIIVSQYIKIFEK